MNQKILEIFYAESEELLQDMETGLLALETNPGDEERIHTVFRAAHNIKGNAGFVGLDSVVDFAHHQENILDLLRQGRLAVSPEVISLLLEAVDYLRSMVEAGPEGTEPDEERRQSIEQRLVEASSEPAETAPEAQEEVETPPPPPPTDAEPPEADVPEPDAPKTKYEISMKLDQALFLTGTDPLMLIGELAELGEIVSIEADGSSLPQLDDLDPEKLYLNWNIVLETTVELSEVENVFIFVSDSSRIDIRPLDETEPPQPMEPESAEPAAPIEEPMPEPTPVEPPAAPEPAPAPLQASAPAPKPEPAPAPKPQPTPKPAPAPKPKPAPAPKPKPARPKSQAAPPKRTASIRVDTDKLDKLVNLVGELVISVARVSQTSQKKDVSGHEMQSAVETLDHISRELQEQVMLVRMVPVEATFTRFQRVVRDLSGELKKKVRLVMSGTETELDKNVIEQINDPLKHLIRNAVDHGMESPEEREAAGKSPQGTIWLRAYQREGSIMIEVADDGHGIDRQAVLDKAVRQGLFEGDGQNLADREVFDFMFRPGFSTAKVVTEVSGRGVGLDVVKRNLIDLRGSIEVESAPGQGSTFRIKLPITLAIIDGMTVRVGQEIFTAPLMSIIESLRPKPNEIKTVEGSGELFRFRDRYLPLVRLHELFDLPTDRTDPTKALVIVIESRSRQFGVMVDDIEDEIQAVIKSLEKNYYQVEGVAGATILGDGSISLILDIHSLERLAFGDD